MNLTETDKAYIAGLFDGEGSIFIVRQKPGGSNTYPSYSLRATISNNDLKVLQWTKDKLNGLVSYLGSGSYRCNMLCLQGHRALEFLKVIEPYIKIKCRQIDLAEDFMEYGEAFNFRGKVGVPEDTGGTREDYYQLMKALNKGGD